MGIEIGDGRLEVAALFEEQLNARLSDLRRAARDSARRIEWEEISRPDQLEVGRRMSTRGKPFRGWSFSGHGLQHAKGIRKSLGVQK